MHPVAEASVARVARFDRAHVEDWLVWGLRAFLVAGTAWAFLAPSVASGQTDPWMVAGSALLGLVVGLLLSAAPTRDLRALRVVEATLLLSTALHVLGHLGGFYDSVLPYDDAVHAVGGLLAGVAAVALVRGTDLLLPHGHATRFRVAFVALGLVSFFIVGVEVWEFGSDQLLGTREQTDPDQTPLVDTMMDLVAGLVGGAIAIGVGVLLTWRGRVHAPDAALEREAERAEAARPHRSGE